MSRRNYGMAGVKTRRTSSARTTGIKKARLSNAAARFMGLTRARNPIVRLNRSVGYSGFYNQSSKPEVKSVDIGVIAQVPSTTGLIEVVNLIQTGSGFWQRIGRKIKLKSLHITGSWDATGTGAGAQEYNRLLVVYDRQCNGAVPSIADILQNVDQTGTPTSNSRCNINLANTERFMIIRDFRFAASSSGTAGLSVVQQQMQPQDDQNNKINWFIPLKGLETLYSANSSPAVVGDISTGALYIVSIGNVSAATAGFEFTYSARLRFMDP